MDALNIAIWLLNEAAKELKLYEEYKRDEKRLYKNGGNVAEWTMFRVKYPHPPKKAHINDNIKLARRLLNDARVD